MQVSVRRESADERIAADLHIAVGDEILVRERVMSADGQPVQLATSWLPRTLTAGTAIERTNTGPGGIYARLEKAGYQLDHFVERVTCRVASDAESSALQLSRGSPVLAVTRTAYDTNGTPVETNDMVLAGDRYELIYELPAD